MWQLEGMPPQTTAEVALYLSWVINLVRGTSRLKSLSSLQETASNESPNPQFVGVFTRIIAMLESQTLQ
jgi:hypothetical protein